MVNSTDNKLKTKTQEGYEIKPLVYKSDKDAKLFSIEDLDNHLEIERLARLMCKRFNCEDCGSKSLCDNKRAAAEILEYYKRK